MAELTVKQVRRIAKEESDIAIREAISEIKKQLDENNEVLKQLKRLLLGEIGINEEESLRKKAVFAYAFAKKEVDKNMPERIGKVVEWYEDNEEIKKGSSESNFETNAKMRLAYRNFKWLIGLLGVTTVMSAIPVIERAIGWIEKLSS